MAQHLKISWVQLTENSEASSYNVYLLDPNEAFVVGVTPPVATYAAPGQGQQLDFYSKDVPSGAKRLAIVENRADGKKTFLLNTLQAISSSDVGEFSISSGLLTPKAVASVTTENTTMGSDTYVSLVTDPVGNQFLIVTNSSGAYTSSDPRPLYTFNGDSSGAEPTFSDSSWPQVSVSGTLTVASDVTATIGTTSGGVLTVNGFPAYQFASDAGIEATGGSVSNWNSLDSTGQNQSTDYVEYNPDDVDNDGIPNVQDADYVGNADKADTDGDNVIDDYDTDDDNDGVEDSLDADSTDANVGTTTTDTDGDGITDDLEATAETQVIAPNTGSMSVGGQVVTLSSEINTFINNLTGNESSNTPDASVEVTENASGTAQTVTVPSTPAQGFPVQSLLFDPNTNTTTEVNPGDSVSIPSGAVLFTGQPVVQSATGFQVGQSFETASGDSVQIGGSSGTGEPADIIAQTVDNDLTIFRNNGTTGQTVTVPGTATAQHTTTTTTQPTGNRLVTFGSGNQFPEVNATSSDPWTMDIPGNGVTGFVKSSSRDVNGLPIYEAPGTTYQIEFKQVTVGGSAYDGWFVTDGGTVLTDSGDPVALNAWQTSGNDGLFGILTSTGAVETNQAFVGAPLLNSDNPQSGISFIPTSDLTTLQSGSATPVNYAIPTTELSFAKSGNLYVASPAGSHDFTLSFSSGSIDQMGSMGDGAGWVLSDSGGTPLNVASVDTAGWFVEYVEASGDPSQIPQFDLGDASVEVAGVTTSVVDLGNPSSAEMETVTTTTTTYISDKAFVIWNPTSGVETPVTPGTEVNIPAGQVLIGGDKHMPLPEAVASVTVAHSPNPANAPTLASSPSATNAPTLSTSPASPASITGSLPLAMVSGLTVKQGGGPGYSLMQANLRLDGGYSPWSAGNFDYKPLVRIPLNAAGTGAKLRANMDGSTLVGIYIDDTGSGYSVDDQPIHLIGNATPIKRSFPWFRGDDYRGYSYVISDSFDNTVSDSSFEHNPHKRQLYALEEFPTNHASIFSGIGFSSYTTTQKRENYIDERSTMSTPMTDNGVDYSLGVHSVSVPQSTDNIEQATVFISSYGDGSVAGPTLFGMGMKPESQFGHIYSTAYAIPGSATWANDETMNSPAKVISGESTPPQRRVISAGNVVSYTAYNIHDRYEETESLVSKHNLGLFKTGEKLYIWGWSVSALGSTQATLSTWLNGEHTSYLTGKTPAVLATIPFDGLQHFDISKGMNSSSVWWINEGNSAASVDMNVFVQGGTSPDGTAFFGGIFDSNADALTPRVVTSIPKAAVNFGIAAAREYLVVYHSLKDDNNSDKYSSTNIKIIFPTSSGNASQDAVYNPSKAVRKIIIASNSTTNHSFYILYHDGTMEFASGFSSGTNPTVSSVTVPVGGSYGPSDKVQDFSGFGAKFEMVKRDGMVLTAESFTDGSTVTAKPTTHL